MALGWRVKMVMRQGVDTHLMAAIPTCLFCISPYLVVLYCIIIYRIGFKCMHGSIGAWWIIGRFVAFCPNGRGFEFRSSRHVGTLGKFFTRSCMWRFGVKLRHCIRAVSGAPLSSS